MTSENSKENLEEKTGELHKPFDDYIRKSVVGAIYRVGAYLP